MKTILKRALCFALTVISVLSLASCYAFNKVHTPYDDISNLGKYIRLASYKTELKKSDIKEMMDTEIQSFIRSNAEELLVGGNVNDGGTADRPIKKGDDVTVNTTIRVYDENGELKPLMEL